MKLLHKYVNGNCTVSLYDDGTKVREYPDGVVPAPIFPESMDVKITNRCSRDCGFCHERSTPDGAHADIDKLLEVVKPLPAGVEIALGGGNVFEHPELLHLLLRLQLRGLVVNTTVKLEDAIEHEQELHHFQGLGLIHGLGISVPSDMPHDSPKPLFANANVVWHLIAGVNSVSDLASVQDLCRLWGIPCKVLVLGFKMRGKGIGFLVEHEQEVVTRLQQWRTTVARMLEEAGRLTLSFDNLALVTLSIKACLSPEQWQKFYMGDDGQFTMYVDAVKQEYARSSTSANCIAFDKAELRDYFKSLTQSLV